MFGGDRNDFDYSCYSCGAGYYAEVGFGPSTCDRCGGPLDAPMPPPQDHPDDDVLLDSQYMMFSSVKAFRIIKQLGRLDECMPSNM